MILHSKNKMINKKYLKLIRSRNRDYNNFIYDTIAGGAGFSHKIADCGLELFERALKILKNYKMFYLVSMFWVLIF